MSEATKFQNLKFNCDSTPISFPYIPILSTPKTINIFQQLSRSLSRCAKHLFVTEPTIIAHKDLRVYTHTHLELMQLCKMGANRRLLPACRRRRLSPRTGAMIHPRSWGSVSAPSIVWWCACNEVRRVSIARASACVTRLMGRESAYTMIINLLAIWRADKMVIAAARWGLMKDVWRYIVCFALRGCAVSMAMVYRLE